jgi:DNA polymerase III subunit gamma/tau
VSYLVLARKYRPQTFDDLAGQDHVARTLANAIATQRVAHAFLFTGVRGVGKTTSARLLAKCLNCVGPDGKSPGPTSKPCNECAPCREIAAGQDLDVQEIDGASYNGVDEVRRLQEGMSFRPARDRFKVYIVDEVHMLTTAAWNAFLKTLEEPPPHVKFVFATTDVQKVPITILSRCQRYDFKLISTQTIAKRLDHVLAREGIAAQAAAVQLLAREAAGSMRDAMSLLDQVIAFGGENVTAEAVTTVLGVADRTILHELAAALISGDAAACLGIVDQLAEQGFDLGHVARDMLRHLRNLIVAKVSDGGKARDAGARRGGVEDPSLRELLDLADEEVREVVDLASRTDADDLSRLFQGFSQAFDDVVRSSQPRMALEMALVRLARRPPLLPLDELLSRVGDLERRIVGSGGPATPPPAPVPRGGGGGGSTGPRGIHAPAGTAPGAVTSGPVFDPGPGAGRTHGALALSTEAPRAHPAEGVRPVVVSFPAPVVHPPAAPAATVPAIEVWRAILDRLRASRPAIASVFEHAMPMTVTAGRIVLGFESPDGFAAARASEASALGALRREAAAYFGTPTEIVLQGEAMSETGVRSVAVLDAENRSTAIARARAAVEEHPVVREAIRLFGARVQDVKLPNLEG